jgi:group I intron endonuclease
MDFVGTGGIYEIVNANNGKRYVGSAVNFARRWAGHQCRLRAGRHHNRHLQSAWNKHGAGAFTFKPLLVCEKRDLLMYEQIALDALRPEFNVEKIAGSSIGCARTPETRAKIAAKARGRQWTPEAKAKLSATVTGRKLSDEHRATLLGNKRAKGMKHTDEWKSANAARNTGVKRPKDAEYRAKIAATLRGRKATAEARANQSAAQLGKKRGPYKPKRAT